MRNFLYECYPYGLNEMFVEYEMQAFEDLDEEFNIWVLRPGDKSKMRYIPKNAMVNFIEGETLSVKFLGFMRLFKKNSLCEIFKVLKRKHKEGMLRCLNRIYRYQKVAVLFEKQYKNSKCGNSDVFVSYWLNECAFALVELKKKYPNIKIASRGHGYDVFEERCYLPFRRDILSGLDKIYLINKASKEYFNDHYSKWLDVSKIEISHLGVNIPQNVTPKDNGTFKVVTCSSVIPLKRLDLIIDALANLKEKNIEWVHFGGGSLFEKMKQYAAEKLEGGNLKYEFKGQVPLNDVHEFYKTTSVNLFVNCSDTEGTPVSVMEAMSYGIPSVARNVGGMAEVLDENCGILLPKEESIEQLKDAIERFYVMNSEEYVIYSKNARQKIENEFDAKRVFKEYINTIYSL